MEAQMKRACRPEFMASSGRCSFRIINAITKLTFLGGAGTVTGAKYLLDMLSAHADWNEIISWLGNIKNPPRMTFVVHGEPGPADALRHRIKEELGWACAVPEHHEQVNL
jgi:Cft2 family RNA processing exonuclease